MSFFLGKIGISISLLFTSIAVTLGLIQPTPSVVAIPSPPSVVSSRTPVADVPQKKTYTKTKADDTPVASTPSSKTNKINLVELNQMSGKEVGFSIDMQALGCTDEISCKALCSKAENSDKCRSLFNRYNSGNQNNSQVGSNLRYEYLPRDCKNNPNPVFSHDITDTSKISSIYPPAHVIGGELKTRAYVHITDRVPLYAPVDAVLVEGAYHYTVDGLTQYSLYFQVSCEVRFLFDHISDPIGIIKSGLPSTPSRDSRTSGVSHPITFKAGDLIGYTGGPDVGKTFDFAVFNNTLPNYFNTQPDFNKNWIYVYAVCPFNYFIPDKKSVYFSLFGDDSGQHTTPVELCK